MESPAKDDIEQLLAVLGKVGDFHSQGRFTLDYERSKLLLERFQLPTPAHFVYCLIAAAALSFPSEIQITIRTDGIEVSFDGRPFAQDELEQASGSLFLSSRNPDTLRLQELAIGMAGATRWGATHFEVDSRGPRNRIGVGRASLLTKFKGMFGRFGQAFDENELRHQLCSVPSCQISINNRPVSQPPMPDECLIYSQLGPIDHPVLTRSVLPPLRNPSLEEFSHQDAAPDQQDMVYVFLCGSTGESNSIHFGSLIVVLNGRQFRFELPTRLRHVHAIVIAHSHKKDLSQQTLAKFEIDALISDLERHQLTLLRHLASVWTILQEHQIPPATEWLLLQRSQSHIWYSEWPAVAEQYRAIFRSVPLLQLVGEKKTVSINEIRAQTPVTYSVDERTPQKIFYYTRQAHWQHPALNGTRTLILVDSQLLAALKSELGGSWSYPDGANVEGEMLENHWELESSRRAHQTRDLFFTKSAVPLNTQVPCWCKILLDPELDDGWIGELGLAQNGGPLGRVTLCHQRRPVNEVTLSTRYGYPDILVGVVENPVLEPNFDCTAFHINQVEELNPPISAVSRLLSVAVEVFQQQASLRSNHSGPEELRRALVVGLTHPQPDPELAKLKLFELASKSLNEQTTVSYEELVSQRNSDGALRLSRRRFEITPSDGQAVLLQEGWLEELTGLVFGQTENIEIPLRIQEKRGRTLKTWSNSERLLPQLDSIPQLMVKVLVRESALADAPVIGEIGCTASSALGPSRVHYLSDGRSLGVQMVPTSEDCARNPKLRQLPAGLRAIVNSPALLPNEDCSAPLPDQPWVDCINRLWQTLPQLAVQLVPLFEQRNVSYRNAQLHFFQILHASRISITSLTLPEELKPLLQARCLKSLCGEVGSISELLQRLSAKSPTILFISDTSAPSFIEDLPLILWFEPSVLEAFQLLFYEFHFENAESLYLEALYHREQESREKEVPQLPEGAIGTRHIQSESGFSGLVGLIADSQIPEGNFRLRVLSNGKLVEQFVIEENTGLVSQVGKQIKPIPGVNELSVRRPDPLLRAIAVIEKSGLHHPLPVDFQATVCQLLRPELDQLGSQLYQDLVERQTSSPQSLAKSEQSLFRSLQDYLLSRFPAFSNDRGLTSTSLPCSQRLMELSSLPLFMTNQRIYVSMDRLLEELRKQNRILYTLNDTTSVPPEIFVIHSRRAQITNLKMILGPTALAEATKLERAYEAKDSYYSRPVQSLALPEHSYLKVWDVSAACENQATPPFSYRAIVGLHPNTDWSSTYTVYFDGRILETVRQVHPFSMEVAIEIEGLSVHSNYRGFVRDALFEAVVAKLESQVSELILAELPGEFHLRVIVEGRPTTLWFELPLFKNTQGQSYSFNDLKSDDWPYITYYWPTLRETVNPDLLPLGLAPLVLSVLEVNLLSKAISRLENIEAHVKGAQIHLQQLPDFPECPAEANGELLALHGNGRTWLLSDLTSQQQTLRFYWKQYLVSESHKSGWPGWTGHLDLCEHVLNSEGELPRSAVHQAEINSQQTVSEYWMKRNLSGALSLDDCKRCLPFIGSPGELQSAIRKRLGIGRFEGYGGWELEMISKVVSGLQSLHQTEQVRLNFESLDGICAYRKASDGSFHYILNNKNPETRQHIQNLSPNWLLTTLWNEFLEAADAPSAREGHEQLLRVLCDN